MKVLKDLKINNESRKINASEIAIADSSNKYKTLDSVVEDLSNIGKFIKLGKSEVQAINANTDTLVVWSTERENTTDGILTRDGNNVKCVSGNHTVLINAKLQLMSNPTNRYLYIHKISGSSDTTVSTAVFYSGTPMISTVINLSEGESINIHTYSEMAANNSSEASFNEFTVTLLN